ncbi:unnamed protein product, partial [Mesorhabditis spiculigera]
MNQLQSLVCVICVLLILPAATDALIDWNGQLASLQRYRALQQRQALQNRPSALTRSRRAEYNRNCFFSPVQCMLQYNGHVRHARLSS